MKPAKFWETSLSKKALKFLSQIDRKTANKLLDAIEELEKLENPKLHGQVRPLTGNLRGFYRLRSADYRIIFELNTDAKLIGVLKIVPRENAYR